MSWRKFRCHFKQVFRGGYRYLDTCGEFMVAAERELRFLPQEAKPVGCKMAIPEEDITMNADANQLLVTQELPEGIEVDPVFFGITDTLSALASEYFKPLGIETNGYACESFLPMDSMDAAVKESLRLGGQFQSKVEQVVGMTAYSQELDYQFISGNSELHVNVRPVTFEKQTVQRFAPGFRSTEESKRVIERWNKKANKSPLPVQYALMLMTDLVEKEPPADSRKKHFDRMEEIDQKLKAFGFTT